MIFIDTSALIALNLENDKFHQKALLWWQKNKGAEIITSNFIIAETLGWVRYVSGKNLAVELGKYFFESAEVKIIQATLMDEQEAWKLFQKLPGKGISFVDCLSFALMKRTTTKSAFTFDADFSRAGFDVLP